jgi:hypothetical protein
MPSVRPNSGEAEGAGTVLAKSSASPHASRRNIYFNVQLCQTPVLERPFLAATFGVDATTPKSFDFAP